MQQFAAPGEILRDVSRHGSGSDPPEPTTPERTRTDGSVAHKWIGERKLLHLREWATDKVHRLPEPATSELVIGSESSVDFQIVAPNRRVSRRHARLVCTQDGWHIEDLGSRNGVRYDGWLPPPGPGRVQYQLLPGMEIGIGGIILVVENETFVRLRSYLARILGWDSARQVGVDLAMRAVRAAFEKCAPRLEIVSPDDLVAVARQIHLRISPPDAPFVVCGKCTRAPDDSLQLTAVKRASAALPLAHGGTVCVRTTELPTDYRAVQQALETSDSIQSYVCATTVPVLPPAHRVVVPIVVPELAARAPSDLGKIIQEYALDACRGFGASASMLSEREQACVVDRDATSFADIESATRRIVAFRTFGNVHQAAPHVGLSHVGLGKWLKGRGLVE
ncbi:MAG: FHA domain-containing protein [Deltaproteobacteria bacterium]|nr:MAG: FHA domain-containing protein [Deltaproteobacteria bacterium]